MWEEVQLGDTARECMCDVSDMSASSSTEEEEDPPGPLTASGFQPRPGEKACERYRRFFAWAAGRAVADGPPGASSLQPIIGRRMKDWSTCEWAEWWVRHGGYGGAEEVDENGWTASKCAQERGFGRIVKILKASGSRR